MHKMNPEHSAKLSRFEFLKRLGFGGASLFAALCLTQSCKEDDDDNSSAAGPKDFTLDLNLAAYSRLKTVGQFVVEQEVVVACTGPGTYAAVTVICSHEGRKQIAYQSGSKDFRCSAHGAVFDAQGRVKTGPASSAIRTYQTSLSGSLLRVFS